MALIPLFRATELLPSFPDSDEATMNDIINASSDVIERYCNRNFSVQTYDELIDGSGDFGILVSNPPIVSIVRVAYAPIMMMGIANKDQAATSARWSIDGDTYTNIGLPLQSSPNNLTLLLEKAGQTTTIVFGPLTSASPTVTINNGTPTGITQMWTLADLAAAINTYAGSYGFSALALGIYGSWPISTIRPPIGPFESRWFGYSYLHLHLWNLYRFQVNPAVGEIVAPGIYDSGYQNYRCIYQGGYATVPQPIQQACAALAVSVYQSRGQNPNLQSESLGGYSYSLIAEKSFHSMDMATRYGLALYKNHRIAKYKLG
jgi:hypothetical protein